MKKFFYLSLMLVLVFVVLVGCQTIGQTADDDSDGREGDSISVPTTDGSAFDSSSVESETSTPVADFEYKENENGITITRYIGNDADVVIPDTIAGKPVTEIYDSAFSYSDCQQLLVSVKMPDTVTKIGAMSFQNCLELTTVELSEELQVIYGAAFSNCPKLSEITLPNTLAELYDKAFENCASLKHITIPKGLTYWGSEVFVNSGLETVVLEDGLSCIGSTAFAYTKLREIEIPGSIKELPWQAVAGCYGLETIILHEGLETINRSAFDGAVITEIVIPKSVECITETAFSNCERLKAVKFDGEAPVTYLDELMPDELTGLDNVSYTVYYHEGVEGFTSPEWYGYPTIIW